jgi:hypothetical protein
LSEHSAIEVHIRFWCSVFLLRGTSDFYRYMSVLKQRNITDIELGKLLNVGINGIMFYG